MTTKYIHLSSANHADGQGRLRIQTPPSEFSVAPNQIMRLTLLSLYTPRAWLTVNGTNDSFFWFEPDTEDLSPITIDHGQYNDYDALAYAVEDAMRDVFDAPRASYRPQTRRLVMTPGATLADGTPTAANGFFVCYCDSSNPAVPPMTSLRQFNDSYMLLGAEPTTSIRHQVVNAFGAVGTGQHVSKLPPVLGTPLIRVIHYTMCDPPTIPRHRLAELNLH